MNRDNRKKAEGTKVYLSNDERKSPLQVVMARYGLSKSTAHRAQQRGFFRRGHFNCGPRSKKAVRMSELPPAKALKPGKSVTLSEKERLLSGKAIRTRYGVGYETAQRALETGTLTKPWPAGRGRKDLPRLNNPPEWSPAPTRAYDPTWRWFRVNLAPAEMMYPMRKLAALYRHLGLAESTAAIARRRGYFCPNASLPFEPQVNTTVFHSLITEVIESAKIGATRALRQFYGNDWRKKLSGATFDDVADAAVEHLRLRSGVENFNVSRWRNAAAKYGALAFLSKLIRRKKREVTTVDRLEGRFDEDDSHD